MSGGRSELPRPFGALFRWLFPTAMGAEACEDLRAAYASLRERHGRLTLLPWCLADPAHGSWRGSCGG